MKNDDKKVCIECKSYKDEGWGIWGELAHCTHDESGEMDLVSGKHNTNTCCVMRMKNGACGHDAKLFEKKVD